MIYIYIQNVHSSWILIFFIIYEKMQTPVEIKFFGANYCIKSIYSTQFPDNSSYSFQLLCTHVEYVHHIDFYQILIFTCIIEKYQLLNFSALRAHHNS